MMIQISLGLGTVLSRPAQATISPAPGNMSTTALTNFSRDRTIFDSGAQLGLAEARVKLAGTTDAPDGAVIEARAVSLDDGGATTTPWHGLTDAVGAPVTVVGGAFSGRLTVPRSTSWFRAETRVQGSSAAPAQMANRFGVGHVWAFFEQSNGSRLISAGGSFSPSAPIFDALAAPDGNVQIVYRGDTSQVFPVTTAARGPNPITPTAVSMANAFHAARPGEKLMMLFHTQQGTGVDDALTKTTEDAAYGTTGGGRDFEAEQAIHARAAIDGTQVGAVFVPGWIESPWGVGGGIPEMYLRRFVARDRTGANVEPVSNNVPRYFANTRRDGSDVIEQPPSGERGFYDLRYTRFGYFGPHMYTINQAPAITGGGNTLASFAAFAAIATDTTLVYSAPGSGQILAMVGKYISITGGWWLMVAAATEANPLMVNANGVKFVQATELPPAQLIANVGHLPGYNRAGDRTYNLLTKNARTIYNSANLPEVFDYPGNVHGGYFDPSDVGHYDGGTRDGRQRLGLMWMFSALRSIGLISTPQARLDVRYDDPAGAYADFGIAGVNITTERLRRSDAAGGGSFTITGANGTVTTVPRVIPALNATYGNALPDADDHRCEVMGWSIDKIPAKSAVVMTASGHPVFPNGRKFCRVYNNGTAFDWKTCIEYGTGQVPGHQVWQDFADRVHLNWLVAENTLPAGWPGDLAALPVQHQGSAKIPSTMATPELFSVVDAHFRNSSGATVTAHNKAYMTALLRMDFTSSGTVNVMGITGNVFVKIGPDGSLILTDNTNTASLPAGTIREGVFNEYHFRVNRTPGSQELAILSAAGAVLATASSLAGNFVSGRVEFCDTGSGGIPVIATIAKMETYLGQTSKSGSPSFGILGATVVPYVTLIGSGLAQNRGTAPTDGVA